MSLHIGAKHGEIAETVLLSGDPLRAKHIAETMLEDVFCYTQVRNMLGYTGYYKGKKVSVQGTGMGQASLAIYVTELLNDYNAKQLIRIGTCGALLPEIQLGELILAQAASTDTMANRLHFNGLDYAPAADFQLLLQAYQKAKEMTIPVRVGGIFSTDLFYFKDDPHRWAVWTDHNTLCADMESAVLYTLAAGARAQAVSLLTVSDNIMTGESSSAEKREKGYTKMAELALEMLL